jgi:hypothetical protein
MSGQEFRRIVHDPRSTSKMLGDALRAYLEARRPDPKPFVVYTRDEYHALVNRRKKRRPKRKKGDADPVLFVYDTVEDERIEARGHHVQLDETAKDDLDWIDAIAKRQQEEADAMAYWGEW